MKKVLGRCRGGFLLSQPPIRRPEIVARVREAVPPQIPVTVKMRRVLVTGPHSRDNFLYDLRRRLWRRRGGHYGSRPHGGAPLRGAQPLGVRREVKQHGGHRTVLGSGDLFTSARLPGDAAQTGVDGVTAARGAIGNPGSRASPSLGRRLATPRAPGLFEQREVIRAHYQLAEQIYGPELCGRQMRKFGIKYRLHPHSLAGSGDAFVAVKRPAGLAGAVLRPLVCGRSAWLPSAGRTGRERRGDELRRRGLWQFFASTPKLWERSRWGGFRPLGGCGLEVVQPSLSVPKPTGFDHLAALSDGDAAQQSLSSSSSVPTMRCGRYAVLLHCRA